MTTKIECPNCQQHIEIESGPFTEAVDAAAKRLENVHNQPRPRNPAAEKLEDMVSVGLFLAWGVFIIGGLITIALAQNSLSDLIWAACFGSVFSLFLVFLLFARLAGIHATLLRLQK